jgi:hypothetical protein
MQHNKKGEQSPSEQFVYWVNEALAANQHQPITMSFLGDFLKDHWPGWRSLFSSKRTLTQLCHSMLKESDVFKLYKSDQETLISSKVFKKF